MACRSCGSENETGLGSEINIHFPGLKGLDEPAVLAFPKLLVFGLRVYAVHASRNRVAIPCAAYCGAPFKAGPPIRC
jgi:hypothetical protein